MHNILLLLSCESLTHFPIHCPPSSQRKNKYCVVFEKEEKQENAIESIEEESDGHVRTVVFFEGDSRAGKSRGE